MPDLSKVARASPLRRVLDWWDQSRTRWAQLRNVDALSADDIASMAEDLGLASEEFLRIARGSEGLTGLLERRLAALHLDAEDIRKLSPLLLGDLRLNCARCPDKERCRDDMAEDPNAPDWESYCPNAGTLRTLT